MTADIGLTDDEIELRATVRAFADEVIAPVAAHHDRTKTFPYDVVRAMADLGLFGLPFPTEYGGGGKNLRSLLLAIEEIARVDQSLAITLDAACALGAMPIYRFGSEEQRQRWLPELCAGTSLAAFALTEDTAGSDASGIRTTATLDAGSWTINGSKALITNAGTDITRLVTITAVTGTTARSTKEISSILVPVPTPGLTVGPAYDKVGWHASDTHPLTLQNVTVAEASLLGERGRGQANFLTILDEGRLAISALSVGAAQGCVDESLKYARSREAFGQAIGRNQAVSFKIARMQARTHVARTAYRHAAAMMLAGVPFKREAAIAKLTASEAAMDNARDATQIHGGYGFLNDSAVGRHYRDSKVLEIGEGTTEIQLMVIARDLGL